MKELDDIEWVLEDADSTVPAWHARMPWALELVVMFPDPLSECDQYQWEVVLAGYPLDAGGWYTGDAETGKRCAEAYARGLLTKTAPDLLASIARAHRKYYEG